MRLILAVLVCGSSWLGTVWADGFYLNHTTRDWADLGAQAAVEGLPVAILVTAEDCGYCERLKQRLLEPMQKAGAFEGRLIGAELSRDAGGKVLDFDGERVRTRLFLNRYGVFATPTLLLVDPKGRLLIEPIVGFNGADAYRTLLDKTLNGALAALESLDRRRGMAASVSASATSASSADRTSWSSSWTRRP